MLYTRTSTIPAAGYGLYTSNHIKQGQIVLSIKNPVRVKTVDDDHWRPHDSYIYLCGGGKSQIVFDADFRKGVVPPNWYFVNHSETPNLALKMIEQVICWVALNDIDPGSELFFMYQHSKVKVFDEPKILDCKCSTIYAGEFMICCDECGMWWHPVCMNLTKRDVVEYKNDKLKPFRCSQHTSPVLRGLKK